MSVAANPNTLAFEQWLERRRSGNTQQGVSAADSNRAAFNSWLERRRQQREAEQAKPMGGVAQLGAGFATGVPRAIATGAQLAEAALEAGDRVPGVVRSAMVNAAGKAITNPVGVAMDAANVVASTVTGSLPGGGRTLDVRVQPSRDPRVVAAAQAAGSKTAQEAAIGKVMERGAVRAGALRTFADTAADVRDAEIEPRLKKSGSRFMYDLGQSGPGMAFNAAAAIAGTQVAGPKGGLAASGVVSFMLESGDTVDTLYEDFRSDGMSKEDAYAYALMAAVPAGTAKAAIEQAGFQSTLIRGMSKVAGRLKLDKQTFAKAVTRYVGDILAEGGEEVAQGTIDRIVREVTTGQGVAPVSREAFDQAVYEFALGAAGGALFGAPGSTIEYVAERRARNAQTTATSPVAQDTARSGTRVQDVRAPGQSVEPVESGEAAPAERPVVDVLDDANASDDEVIRALERIDLSVDGQDATQDVQEEAARRNPPAPAIAPAETPAADQAATDPAEQPRSAPAAESPAIELTKAGEASTDSNAVTQDATNDTEPPVEDTDPLRVKLTNSGYARKFLVERAGLADVDEDAGRVGKSVAEAERGIAQLNGRDVFSYPELRNEEYRSDEARKNLRKQAMDELMTQQRLDDDDNIRLGTGGALPKTPLRKDRVAVIVLGPPAAGKSGIANRLSDSLGAMIVDNDYAKRKIPEFHGNSIGAMLVHTESDDIINAPGGVLDQAVDDGRNIVIPVVGKTYSGVENKIKALKGRGYNVRLVNVVLPTDKVLGRAARRFDASGRYVSLSYIAEDVAEKPSMTYDRAKKEGLADEYLTLSTDVERGQPWKQLEGSLERTETPDPDGARLAEQAGSRGRGSVREAGSELGEEARVETDRQDADQDQEVASPPENERTDGTERERTDDAVAALGGSDPASDTSGAQQSEEPAPSAGRRDDGRAGNADDGQPASERGERSGRTDDGDGSGGVPNRSDAPAATDRADNAATDGQSAIRTDVPANSEVAGAERVGDETQSDVADDVQTAPTRMRTTETIDVDGFQRPTTNSDGRPLASDETGIREFWKWFGDSKAVDSRGRPLVVYHGTPLKEGLTEFKLNRGAAYFSSKREIAEQYTSVRGAWRSRPTGVVLPVYLSVQKPLVIEAAGKRHDNIPVPWQEWKPKVFGNIPKNAVTVEKIGERAQSEGADGAIVRNVIDTADLDDRTTSDVYVVFSPEQIRFVPTDPPQSATTPVDSPQPNQPPPTADLPAFAKGDVVDVIDPIAIAFAEERSRPVTGWIVTKVLDGIVTMRHPSAGRQSRATWSLRADQIRRNEDTTETGEAAAPTPAPTPTPAENVTPATPAPVATPAAVPEPARDPNAVNHIIRPGELDVTGGVKAKMQANLAALELLQKLEAEGRNATASEKRVLANFTGWGWAGEVFNEAKAAFAKDRTKLQELMTEAEYASARKSTLNAHYTAEEVVRPMWDLVKRLGFKGGRVLEPAAGSGNFLGMMPEDMRESTQFVAVELDSLTGRLLRKLYPESDVRVQGFETAQIANNSIDLAISNVPFGGFRITGRDYDDLFIHDYFFARALDKLRPGGLLVFVTSDGTLNKVKDGARVRQLLASKADLVGAIRLPNDAFAKNAGTQVTTDIIVMRKKDGTPFQGEPFINLAQVGEHPVAKMIESLERRVAQLARRGNADAEIAKLEADIERYRESGSETVPIMANEYFAAHPEMALGRHTLEGTMYNDNDYALVSRKGVDLGQALQTAINALPENVVGNTTVRATDGGSIKAEEGERFGSYVERDGVYYVVGRDGLEPADWTKQKLVGDDWDVPIDADERARRIEVWPAWNNLRKAAVALVTAENSVKPKSYLDGLRAELNEAYDAYVKKFGTLNRKRESSSRVAHLAADPDYPLVISLEVQREVRRTIKAGPNKGKSIIEEAFVKHPIFEERQMQPRTMPTSAKDINEAVSISLGYRNTIDPAVVGELLGISSDDAQAQVLASGLAFVNPTSGMMEPKTKYLSGNVRRKLVAAREAAQQDERYAGNVTALEAVVPRDVDLGDITYSLASRWMPEAITSKFASDLFATDVEVRYVRAANGYDVSVAESTAEILANWTVRDERRLRMSASQLLTHALNNTRPVVTETITVGGQQKTQVLQAQTAQAQALVDKMNAEFVTWLRTTDAMIGNQSAQMLAMRMYNDTLNAVVPPVYDGSHLVLPGASKTVRKTPHRMSVVYRILQEGAAVMAHGVGSGKTFSIIVSAMEMRRLGLARKPMIVVQKATLGQFVRSFKDAYPAAKILVATNKTFAAKNRKRLMAQVALGDWDAVICTHPQFDLISVGAGKMVEYLRRKVAELESLIQEERRRNGKKAMTTKQLEAAKASLEAKIAKTLEAAKDRQDVGVKFEDMGIDAVFIDEAHMYKNVPIVTRMQRVKGIPQGNSDRALLAEIKLSLIQERQNGRGVVLATGTPITNSMAEAYVMLKLATPKVLSEFNIENFDEFANTFGQPKGDVEFTYAGRYEVVTRFKKFVNGPELIRLIRAGFDVKMGNAELGLDVPRIKGGQPEIVTVPGDESYEKIKDMLMSAVQTFETAKGVEKRELSWVPITVMQAGMAAALDPRLIDANLPDSDQSKLSVATRRIVDIYRKSSDYRGTQIVFADKFNTMDTSRLRSVSSGGISSVDGLDIDGENETLAALRDDDTDAEAAARNEAKADDSAFRGKGFNLHKALRDKLIDAGIPAGEIALVMEANTDQQREALFERVNRGEIRVIIGTTDRLGVGVNIQQRLVAMHELDPPRSMTPAMSEQREGRIVRQGNLFATEQFDGVPNPEYRPGFEIELIKYGMKGSMDIAIYGIIANKRKFIVQALTDKGVGRTFDDPGDQAAMTASQMKAQLADDPELIRAVELDQKIDQLSVDKESHERQQLQRRQQISEQRANASFSMRLAMERAQKASSLSVLVAPDVKAEIYGEKFTGEAQIKEALKPVWQAAAQGKRVTFTLANVPVTAIQTVAKAVDGSITASVQASFSLGGMEANIKAPVPGRFFSHIRSYIEETPAQEAQFRAEADRANAVVKTMEAQPVTPWAKQAELDAAVTERAEIEQRLIKRATDAARGRNAPTPTPADGMEVDGALVNTGGNEAARAQRGAFSRRRGAVYNPFNELGAMMFNLAQAAAKRAGQTRAIESRAQRKSDRTITKLEKQQQSANIRLGMLERARRALTRDTKAQARALASAQRRADQLAAKVDDAKLFGKTLLSEYRESRSALSKTRRALAKTMNQLVAERERTDKLRGKLSDTEQALLEKRLQVSIQSAVRGAVTNVARELPVRLRGNFITQVRDAKSLRDVLDAMQKADELQVKDVTRSARKIADRMTSRAVLGRMTEDARTKLADLKAQFDDNYRQATAPLASAGLAADELVNIAERMRAIVHEVRVANKLIRLETWLDADAARVAVLKAMEKRKQLGVEDDGVTRKQPGWFKEWFVRGNFNARTIAAALDDIWVGMNGTVGQLFKAIEDGTLRSFELREAALSAANVAAMNAGYQNLAHLMAVTSGSLGEGLHVRVPVRLAGENLQLTYGQLAKLYSTFQDVSTWRLIRQGKSIRFRDAGLASITLTTITDKDVDAVRDALPPALREAIDEMKRARERMFPAVQAVIRAIKGYEPIKEFNYEPRTLDREVQFGAEEMELFDSEGETRYIENAGFTINRKEDKTTPLLIGDFFEDWTRTVNGQADVIALATPIRNARLVLLHPDVKQAVAGVYGDRAPARIKDILIDASGLRNAGGKATRVAQFITRMVSASRTALRLTSWMAQLAGVPRLWAAMRDNKAFAAGLRGMFKKGTAEGMMQIPYVRRRYAGSLASVNSTLGDPTSAVMMESGQSLRDLLDRARLASRALAADVAVGDIKGAAVRAWVELAETVRISNWFDAIPVRIAYAGFSARAKELGKDETWVREQTVEALREVLNSSDATDLTTFASKLRNNPGVVMTAFTSDAASAFNQLYRGWRAGGKERRRAVIAMTGSILYTALGAGLIDWIFSSLVGEGKDDEERLTQAASKASIRAIQESFGMSFMADKLLGDVPRLVTGLGGGRVDLFDSMATSAVNQTATSAARFIQAMIELFSEDEKKADRAGEKALVELMRFIENGGSLVRNPFAAPMASARRAVEASMQKEEE